MFEGLKARLESLLADHTPPGDRRDRAALLHSAMVEAKVALGVMRDALTTSERALVAERQQLEDAERRGRLAALIPDPETVQIAELFVVRHRERIVLLEQKLAVQREELRLTQRDVDQLSLELRETRQGGSSRSSAQEAAWRDLEAAGGVRPETDLNGDLLKSQLTRDEMQAAVNAQLEHLKKKMKKD